MFHTNHMSETTGEIPQSNHDLGLGKLPPVEIGPTLVHMTDKDKEHAAKQLSVEDFTEQLRSRIAEVDVDSPELQAVADWGRLMGAEAEYDRAVAPTGLIHKGDMDSSNLKTTREDFDRIEREIAERSKPKKREAWYRRVLNKGGNDENSESSKYAHPMSDLVQNYSHSLDRASQESKADNLTDPLVSAGRRSARIVEELIKERKAPFCTARTLIFSTAV